MSPAPSVKDRLVASLVALLGRFYLGAVSLTSRRDVRYHPEALALVEGRRPCIFAFWHRYQLLMAWVRRGEGIHVLVSRSRDGELIAQALHGLGYRTARGSSTRGGAAALIELIRAVSAGGQAGVTPDGPKGPFRSVHPGLLALSRKTGAPVVPCGWATTRAKELRSWDRFLVPLPFARTVVVHGKPLLPADEASLQAALDAAAAEAESALKGDA